MERCPLCHQPWESASNRDRFGPRLECSTEFRETPPEKPGAKPGGVFVMHFRLRVPIYQVIQED